MAVVFAPLYWIYHDCWKWDGGSHAGHIHFFMQDYNPLTCSKQQAYSGSQIYKFAIVDKWGPNSSDPNQTYSYKLLGKPRWYFRIEEYWRRIYVQQWDTMDYNERHPLTPDRGGLKYDASKPCHSLGPFREGTGMYFFHTELNRTLPVEYWKDEDKTERDCFVKKTNYATSRNPEGWDETSGGQIWHYPKKLRRFTNASHVNYSFYGYNSWYLNKDGASTYPYPGGYNKPGEIVSINGKYYRYSFNPSLLVDVSEEDKWYWPCPIPGSSPKEMRNSFLKYYDFNSEDGNTYVKNYNGWLKREYDILEINAAELDAINVETATSEAMSAWLGRHHKTYLSYEDWLEGREASPEMEHQYYVERCLEAIPFVEEEWEIEQFETYVSLMWQEFEANCHEGNRPENKLRRELVDYTEYSEIWQLLDDNEVAELGLNGDYPQLLEGKAVPQNYTDLPKEQQDMYLRWLKKNPNAESPFLVFFKTYLSQFNYEHLFEGDSEVNPFRGKKTVTELLDENNEPSGEFEIEWSDELINPFDVYKTYFNLREEYAIPRESMASGNASYGLVEPAREMTYSDEDGARRIYSDELYMYPAIEYQKVVQRDWQRLPGKEAENDIDVYSDVNCIWGDGFNVDIKIPFTIDDVIQSPFSDDTGKVYPPGNYFHGFEDKGGNMLQYNFEIYGPVYETDETIHPADALSMMSDEDITNDLKSALIKIKKYRRQEFEDAMSDAELDIVEWYNKNYANRSILLNELEGDFDDKGRWVELLTQDRERIKHCMLEEGEDGIIRPTSTPIKPLEFNNPGYPEDGVWVEQCLGAIVKARCELVFEDTMGHRFVKVVENMEAKPLEDE